MDEPDSVYQEVDQPVADPRPWLFKPGQSGNPAGRPKDRDSIKAILNERLRIDGRAVVNRLFEAALVEKRTDALFEILNRGLGKVPVAYERSEDERDLAYSEMQLRFAELLESQGLLPKATKLNDARAPEDTADQQ